jgi:hypothetical protein
MLYNLEENAAMATQQNRNPFMGDDVFCMRLCAFMIHMQKKLCGTPQAGPRTLAMVAQTLAGGEDYEAAYRDMRAAFLDCLRRRGNEAMAHFYCEHKWIFETIEVSVH